MSNMPRQMPVQRTHPTELSHEERMQLNAIIDLLIPSDKDFPPPSSLHLIDEFLIHLLFNAENKVTCKMNMKQLHTVLHELNVAAGGNFCKVSSEKQRQLLRQLEQRDPAFFQKLWTLANHGYYTRLAVQSPASPPALT